MVVLPPHLYLRGPVVEHVSEEVINLVTEWAFQTSNQLFCVAFETVLELLLVAQSLIPIPCIHCLVHLFYSDCLPLLHILFQESHALTFVLIHCLLEHPEKK